MGSLSQQVARPSALGRELDAARVLPYARHVNAHVIALDSGALMMSFVLDGASFETADLRDLNDWQAKLNGAWRNLASDRLAVWHHLVRREATTYPEGSFRSDFARDLDQAYRSRLTGQRMYANALYVTLVLHPGREAADRTQAWVGRLLRASRVDLAEDDAVRTLEDAGRDLVQHLSRYAARALGVYERAGLTFSEPLEMLRLVLTGESQPVPVVRGHLGAALYDVRVIFGREALEIRGAAETTYAGLFGIKEYPATTRPGLWDGLLSAPFAFVASQSFSFLSKTAAQAVMTRKQNQMLSARDRAASQIEGLDTALDELMSNRFVMGDHQASVLVYGDTPRALADHMSRARALLADSGLVVAREDLGLEAAFWSQFPGNFRLRLRPAAINSRNFASLAPFHTHPAGKAEGNHWGAAVALLRTSAGSPYYFNFHVGDLGHTFICGPSGSGKTVVQNFMLAELEKLGAQQVFIDKDRGAEIFVRACGGTYLALRPGEPTGFAPLKALSDTPANRAFLGALIRQLVTAPDRPLTPAEENAIDGAIAALAPLPADQRSISALRALLGQRDAAGVGARLDRWRRGGALGWALDGEADALALNARFMGFDMTHLLDAAEVRTPVMMYLFHRLQALVDGRRLVIDIDEFWKALGDEAFRGLAEDGLKTFRKQNAVMVFGTQSPADVLRSPIAHTILEQCATKIFLPNPHASERDYIDGFGLTQREYALVREELSASDHRFLIKQGLNSVVVELDLTGLDDALAVLSGRAETVDLLERIRAIHGDDPGDWLEPFHQARRQLP
ncbi:MAG: VirB4 family type IV secretion/conjugal transfer ATPase [Alphaproteobacteria bacterium]|nr:VirB4 family type IV secretion/conjugal transfer ATPase [Alphaproteobacteria bacterium]MBU1516581.1 VirB4 family type IV secretion/conjugal transfer ATPase [Alphaproteobacteria bacterium]MBU2094338.1 VirB4 family type IV secretion/conjugal transfer ATPase [Alphaproteobacteria bacterium]MBU2307508.1 VirB4 family type IV secretion/conjugal transfer ATPase [Alphaproteobacteria bacterium]MBU2361649.1 VirB4 family type IV secretion/conjugal transfer ATPase [Alphaproteobacteria bacterium]